MDALLTRVNSIDVVPAMTLERSFYPLAELVKLATDDKVKSFLIPGPDTPMDIMDRSGTRGESVYSFEIGIFKKIKTDDNAEIDPLMKLADNVRQFLVNEKFPTLENSPAILRSRFEPSYDQETLNNLSIFLSIIRFEVKCFQNV